MKRLILILVVIGTTITSMAQNVEDKLSASTQMLLSELRGEITLPKADATTQPLKRRANARTISTKDVTTQFTRPIVQPEYVNGVKVISAFLSVNDNDYSKAKALGVIIQRCFGNVATALIPTDKIMEVAALPNVTNIEVGEIMQSYNDQQRLLSGAYDAITNSSAAQALGITSPYTGKGVIVGVIDRGIDFQHLAFKDKNGKTRIKRAYTLSGSTLVEHTTESAINSLTTDINSIDHGTHTSSTAGGSSVIVNGNNVTVTDDHANATYGGSAPEADLVLCGLSTLENTQIANAIGKICDFADAEGKPCVINLSVGSMDGPHDGTGPFATVLNNCAGDNHIIVFSAGNYAMKAAEYVKLGTSNGGGCYASGTSTYSKPMMANIQRSYNDADGNYTLDAPTIIAYARKASVQTSLKFHVVNTNTGAIVYSTQSYTSSHSFDMTSTYAEDMAKYFKSTTDDLNERGDKGRIYIIRSYDQNNKKYYWKIYAPKLTSTSYTTVNGIKKSNYALCVSIYPTYSSSSNNTIIDMWETTEDGCWFGNDLTLSSTSYNLVKGNDECSVSDNATYPNVISVGAYISKNVVTGWDGTVKDYTDIFPNLGDHGYFSSWQTSGYGPLGTPLPTISGPGARVAAAVNHYHTTSVDGDSYYDPNRPERLVVNNANYPYGTMWGTSMSAPCVSGIIAQWLQACEEEGITANPDYIKEVLANSQKRDEWTEGTAAGAHGAKTFGTNGKIDATAGLKYILGVPKDPVINAEPTSLTFETSIGTSVEQSFHVTGTGLKDNITVTLADENGVFSVSPTTITRAEAKEGIDITVTFSPSAIDSYTGTITLSSEDAESVTINLNATATKVTPDYFDVTISSVGLTTLYLDFPVSIPYETEPDLLGVYYIIGVNGKELRAARLSQDIPANTGVIVQGNSGTYRFYKTNNPTPLKYPTLLSGSTEDITKAQALEQAQKSGTIYTLGKGTDSYINFYPYAENILHANKAFFIYEGENNAKYFTLSFGGEASGISQIDTERQDGTWYTIQGIMLNGKPTQKGLYIHNGNIHIIK